MLWIGGFFFFRRHSTESRAILSRTITRWRPYHRTRLQLVSAQATSYLCAIFVIASSSPPSLSAPDGARPALSQPQQNGPAPVLIPVVQCCNRNSLRFLVDILVSLSLVVSWGGAADGVIKSKAVNIQTHAYISSSCYASVRVLFSLGCTHISSRFSVSLVLKFTYLSVPRLSTCRPYSCTAST